MGDADGDALGVLDRMTRILEAFDQDDGGLGISELAQRAGLPKSTVSRVVGTLVRERYLERQGRLIHIGLRVFELGQLAHQPRELRTAALPVMAHLRNETGQNVHLAIRDGREMVCVAAMRGRCAPPSRVRTGGRLPVHATALGKAALAQAAPTEVDEILSGELEAWTPHTITDRSALTRQLTAIRRGDLATEVREFAPDSACVGVAVSGSLDCLPVALSVSGHADDVDFGPFDAPLRAAAATLGHRLAAIRSGLG
jgi:DNA-binding IclR family transcriptional regulator